MKVKVELELDDYIINLYKLMFPGYSPESAIQEMINASFLYAVTNKEELLSTDNVSVKELRQKIEGMMHLERGEQ